METKKKHSIFHSHKPWHLHGVPGRSRWKASRMAVVPQFDAAKRVANAPVEDGFISFPKKSENTFTIFHLGVILDLRTHYRKNDVPESRGVSSCQGPGGGAMVRTGRVTALCERIHILLQRLAIVAYLLGGWATPLKNMNVNCDEIPNIWEHATNGNQTTNQLSIS